MFVHPWQYHQDLSHILYIAISNIYIILKHQYFSAFYVYKETMYKIIWQEFQPITSAIFLIEVFKGVVNCIS